MMLNNLNDFFNIEFNTHRYPASEQGGMYKPSQRLISRIGLALEPPHHVGDWVRKHNLDSLWLHRPWRLDLAALPPDVGVLYHHLPFDETLTTGYNLPLAAALGLSKLEPLGYKTAPDPADTRLPPRAIGMIGTVSPRSFGAWESHMHNVFGGLDRAESGQVDHTERVAVVGAMNAALIYEAHEHGAGLYLTGEYRSSAQKAVDETGMAVIAIGHHRSEVWGLHALADIIGREQVSVITVN